MRLGQLPRLGQLLNLFSLSTSFAPWACLLWEAELGQIPPKIQNSTTLRLHKHCSAATKTGLLPTSLVTNPEHSTALPWTFCFVSKFSHIKWTTVRDTYLCISFPFSCPFPFYCFPLSFSLPSTPFFPLPCFAFPPPTLFGVHKWYNTHCTQLAVFYSYWGICCRTSIKSKDSRKFVCWWLDVLWERFGFFTVPSLPFGS